MTNTGSFGSSDRATLPVRLSEATVEGCTLLRYDNPAGIVLQADGAAVFATLDAAGRPAMRYEPPLGYDWPLVVGKRWVQHIQLTVGANTRVPMKATWTVEAYEDVTVPAGTFKAWRVVMTDNFGFKQTTWSVPEQLGVYARRVSERPATHPQGGAGTQVLELLSVPTVK